MKNLLKLLCCCLVSIYMSSCTAENLEIENPPIRADDSTNPPIILTDHGGDGKDKDKGDN